MREMSSPGIAVMLTASLLSIALAVAGCASYAGSTAGTHAQRFKLPPEAAARCFARNAEEHSSALVSEVSRVQEGRYEVTVRVKNGVTYAIADIRAAGSGSQGTIDLRAQTPRGQKDLVETLVRGC
jgi:hypothetical protein